VSSTSSSEGDDNDCFAFSNYKFGAPRPSSSKATGCIKRTNSCAFSDSSDSDDDGNGNGDRDGNGPIASSSTSIGGAVAAGGDDGTASPSLLPPYSGSSRCTGSMSPSTTTTQGCGRGVRSTRETSKTKEEIEVDEEDDDVTVIDEEFKHEVTLLDSDSDSCDDDDDDDDDSDDKGDERDAHESSNTATTNGCGGTTKDGKINIEVSLALQKSKVAREALYQNPNNNISIDCDDDDDGEEEKEDEAEEEEDISPIPTTTTNTCSSRLATTSSNLNSPTLSSDQPLSTLPSTITLKLRAVYNTTTHHPVLHGKIDEIQISNPLSSTSNPLVKNLLHSYYRVNHELIRSPLYLKLFYKGVWMEPEHSLTRYNIRDGDVVDVRMGGVGCTAKVTTPTPTLTSSPSLKTVAATNNTTPVGSGPLELDPEHQRRSALAKAYVELSSVAKSKSTTATNAYTAVERLYSHQQAVSPISFTLPITTHNRHTTTTTTTVSKIITSEIITSEQRVNIKTSIKGGDPTKTQVFILKRTDPFSKLIDTYRAQHKYSSFKSVSLEYYGKWVNPNSTPETLDGPVAMDIVGEEVTTRTYPVVIVDEAGRQKQVARMPHYTSISTTTTTSTNSAHHHSSDSTTLLSLKIRINGDTKSSPTIIELHTTSPFQVLIQKFYDSHGVTSSDCKFTFDGDILNPKGTPKDEDLEGGEMIDVVVNPAVLERGRRKVVEQGVSGGGGVASSSDAVRRVALSSSGGDWIAQSNLFPSGL